MHTENKMQDVGRKVIKQLIAFNQTATGVEEEVREEKVREEVMEEAKDGEKVKMYMD